MKTPRIINPVAKPTRKTLVLMKRTNKEFKKQQKDEQWFETFRLAFIACGGLLPTTLVPSNEQLTMREYTSRLIADRIESLRPKQAGYTTVNAIYAGK